MNNVVLEVKKKMNKINNVNLDNFRKTIEEAKTNPQSAKKTTHIEGEWKTEEGIQFRAEIKTSQGNYTIEADEPDFLGGSGLAPSPIHYCVYGGMACYTASFAKWAAMEGVQLNSLRIKADAKMNLSKALGVSDNPVMEGMVWEVFAETAAGQEELDKVKKLADERCPALYCLKHMIDVTTTITRM
ncbi:MAG: OsmC family protein [Candidatus Bathyarchaeota archaeon]